MYAHGPVCVRRLYSNARCSAAASAMRRFQYRLAGTGAEGTGARIKISPYGALHNRAMPGNEGPSARRVPEDPVALALAWLAIAILRRNCNGARGCKLQFQSCPPIQINLAIPKWKSSPALEMRRVLENFQSARLFSLARFFSMRTHPGVRIVKRLEKNLAGAGCQNLTSPAGFTPG